MTQYGQLQNETSGLIKKKDYEAAEKKCAQSIRLAPQYPGAHYNLACRYALLKQHDQALGSLRKAVELGYRDFRFMEQDHDLDSLRKDPRFRALVKECRRK